MTWLAVSTVVQFAVIALLAVTFLSLARQIGVLHERTAPASLVRNTVTLRIGDIFPEMDVTTLAGGQITLGDPTSGWITLLFLAADCPICRSIMPAYRQCLNDAPKIQGYWVTDGLQRDETTSFSQSYDIDSDVLLVSQELGLRFGIAVLPAIAVLDSDSRVVLQNSVNTPRQVVRLFGRLAIPKG